MNADQLSKLPKDLIIYMVLEFNMDMNDIVSLCSSSKKLNKTLCENKSFWISKLKKITTLCMIHRLVIHGVFI